MAGIASPSLRAPPRVAGHVRPIACGEGLLLLDEARDRLLAYSPAARLVWDRLLAGGAPAHPAGALDGAGGRPERRAGAETDAIAASWFDAGYLHHGSPPPRAETSAPERFRGAATPHAGWADIWTSEIGGLRVSFAEEHPEGARLLRNLFGPFECGAGEATIRIEVRHPYRYEAELRVDGRETLRTHDYGLLLGAIYQQLLRRLHPGIDWLAFIHGGAAALDGRAIGFPAPSGSGKTSLVASLMARGFDYMADDLLALSDAGRAVPWPMPLSIKSGSWPAIAPLHPGLADAPVYLTKGVEARLLVPPARAWNLPPLPLKALIFPEYRRGAPATLRPLSTFEAVVRLLGDRIWIGHPLTEQLVVRFIAWISGTRCYNLVHDDLAGAERLVRSVAER